MTDEQEFDAHVIAAAERLAERGLVDRSEPDDDGHVAMGMHTEGLLVLSDLLAVLTAQTVGEEQLPCGLLSHQLAQALHATVAGLCLEIVHQPDPNVGLDHIRHARTHIKRANVLGQQILNRRAAPWS